MYIKVYSDLRFYFVITKKDNEKLRTLLKYLIYYIVLKHIEI